NYDSTKPGNDLKSDGLQVNTVLTAWPDQDRPRRAGVSSFGMGGTNAHVIVEQAPAPPESVVAQPQQRTPLPWVLSARSEPALRNQAARLAAQLASDDDLTATDVAWSLATTRSVFEHRAVLVGADRHCLTADLTRLAAGDAGVVTGRARAT